MNRSHNAKKNILPKEIAASFIALQRAAQRAKEVAKQTHTPLIIVENGQIKQVQV